MEKIEIKGEVITYRYKAIDGTEFKNEENCKKYEDTTECIIRARLNIKKFNEYELTGIGYDENAVEIVSGKSEDIAMYVKIQHDVSYISDLQETIKNILNSEERWMLFYNCDGELWKVTTVTDFVNNIINNLNKNEE